MCTKMIYNCFLQALFETDVDVVSEDGTKVKNSKGATKWVRNSPALTNDDIPMAFGGESKSLLLKVTDWVSYDFYLLCF